MFPKKFAGMKFPWPLPIFPHSNRCGRKWWKCSGKSQKKTSCVLDGRDIGSFVLPDAKFKFYVTADSRVRAERRYKELLGRGQKVDFETLHEEIVRRDKQDSEREFSPLKIADDAIVVDTSDLGIDEVVAKIKSLIQSRI